MIKHIIACAALGAGASFITHDFVQVIGICLLGIALFLKLETLEEKK